MRCWDNDLTLEDIGDRGSDVRTPASPQPPVLPSLPSKEERRTVAKSNVIVLLIIAYLLATLAASVCYVFEKAFGLPLNFFIVFTATTIVAVAAVWLYLYIDSSRP